MQIILLPGVLAGIALGLVFMLMNAAGDNLGYGTRELLGLLAMLAAVAVAQVIALRKHPLGPSAGFPPRYFTAVLAGLATALTYGVFTWVYFTFVDPDYLATFYNDYLARARELALGEGGNEQLVANAERMKGFILDPLSQAMVQFGTTLLIAVLSALGTAAMVKPPPRHPG